MMVSVLMPVYNAEKYLKEAIDSILDQTYEDFELFIVNDGSTDSTEDIIKNFKDNRIKYFKNEKNLGLIPTLNKGLLMVKGKYIARQDADDISLPDRLSIQVDYLERNPELELISSNAYLINEKSEIIGESNLPQNDIDIRFRMLFKCGTFHTSTMFRKGSLEKFNLNYNALYPHSEDYKLWSDLMKQGKAYTLQEKLIKYRTHQESISNKHKKLQEKIASKIVKENIEFIGINISDEEAVRLRALFRTLGMNRKYLLHDINLNLKIIDEFNKKFRKSAEYDPGEILNLLRRMSRWIAKSQLIKIEYLITFIRIHIKIFKYSKLQKKILK